jgi:hypothetical protein
MQFIDSGLSGTTSIFNSGQIFSIVIEQSKTFLDTNHITSGNIKDTELFNPNAANGRLPDWNLCFKKFYCP